MLKKYLMLFLKLAIAGALLTWLFRSGKLDFTLLGKLGEQPLIVALAVVLLILNFWMISVRWRWVLGSRSPASFPLSGLLRITWIGNFFSSILPGSVSGDLVKIFYIQKYDPHLSRKFIFASILVDRIMGLSALILMVGCTSLIFSGHILEKAPAMAPLLRMNYFLSAGVIVALLLFTFCHHWARALLVQAEKVAFARLWQGLISLWDDLVSIRGQMIKGVMLSFVVQINAVVLFWILIQPFVEGNMDFIQALTFIPLGNVTLALPIAPSGLGVGHAIFQKLFEFAGITNGASLFNLYFVVSLFVNVLGVIPYVMTKSSLSKETAEA